VPEIATITGHDLKSVEAILSKHYLGRVQELGKSATRSPKYIMREKRL